MIVNHLRSLLSLSLDVINSEEDCTKILNCQCGGDGYEYLLEGAGCGIVYSGGALSFFLAALV